MENMQQGTLKNFDEDIYLLEFKNEKYFISNLNNSLMLYGEISETPYVANDIRVYTDEKKDVELLRIQTDQNFSYYKTYTIVDVAKSKTIGHVKLSKYKSVFIDQWRLLDADKNDIGYIKEESNFLSILRFMISKLIPQKFYIIIDDKEVFLFEQSFNLFSIKMKLDFSQDSKRVLDKKLAIAYAILCTIKTNGKAITGV